MKHVTGKAIYVDDIREPSGLLHVYVGTSSCAHGRIIGMDLTRVESFPGVVEVITAQDIPGLNDISPGGSRQGWRSEVWIQPSRPVSLQWPAT